MAIRVLHVVPALGRGGAERQLAALVCNTGPEFQHTVCCLRTADAFADEIRRAGHTVVELGLSTRHTWFAGARRVAALIRQQRPDVVNTWLFDACIATRLAQLFHPRLPSIRALQDFIYEPETVRVMGWSPVKVALRKALDRLTAVWSGPLVVTPSLAWEKAAREHLGLAEGQICTIYNSVDPRIFSSTPEQGAAARAALGIPADAMLFLNVGRLDAQKGQSYLLEAFAQVVSQTRDSYLVILGEGPLRAQLAHQAGQLGIESRVRLAGIRDNVGAFLEAADVFVFPSIFEGLGLALVEAMCMGLPCIASRLPALEEVITSEDEGILVEPHQPERLADAMLALYRDGARREALARTAVAASLRKFATGATVPQWEHLYLRILPGLGASA